MDMSGPLYRVLREDRGLVYNVGVQRLLGVDAGCLIILSETSPELLPDLTAALVELLNHLACRGISERELECARAMVLSSRRLAAQSIERVNTATALDVLLGQGADAMDRLMQAVREVSLQQMQLYVQEVFSAERTRCLVQVMPPNQ